MGEYADRDVIQLDRDGGYYCRHVAAMTAEGLHSKAEIAAELAWRDREIARLKATHPQPVTPADCCDTPNFCSSVRRCTAQDGKPHIKVLRDWRKGDNVSTEEFHAAIDCAIVALTQPVTPTGVEVEARAKAMFEAGTVGANSAPWEQQWEPTKEYWRAKAAHPPVADAALSLDDGMRVLNWFLKELRKTADYDPSDTSVGIMSDCWHASSDELATALGNAVAALNQRGGG